MADADKPMNDAPPAEAVAPALTAAVAALKTADGDDTTMHSGTSTPFPTVEEQTLSNKVTLADLCAKGTASYSHKEYEKAADLYAQASQMQAEMNGEMSPDNAEILFLYGRSLFKVGQSKSDVLGGKAPAVDDKPAKKAGEKEEKKAPEPSAAAKATGKEMEKEAEEKTDGKKALFQFTGDENFEDSDDDDNEDGEEDEEEDDMGVAFEVLDLARVLFNKRLEAAAAVAEAPKAPEAHDDKPPKNDGEEEDVEGKGKEVANGEAGEEMTPEVRHVKERLADTHDLLTEISWENERYSQSVVDSRQSLAYKKELYTDDNEIIAEAHYKVSLALEFASVTQNADEVEEDTTTAPTKTGSSSGAAAEATPKTAGFVDEELRKRAAEELGHAIRCTKLNLANKEVELATVHATEENEITRQRIAEVKELIEEMEAKLVDLKAPPIDIEEAVAQGTGAAGGILGALAQGIGGAGAVEEATKGAKDISGLVRKKEKGEGESNGNGHKRKAEDEAGDVEKKAKVEE